MKNYINFHIDLTHVPVEVKKTFTFDDDLILDQIEVYDNNEPLVEIGPNDPNICIAPFWKDRDNFDIHDEELCQLLELEGKILQEYIQKHPNFWILVRKEVYHKLCEVNLFFKQKWYEWVIKIWYRSIEVQKKLFDEIFAYFSKKLSQNTSSEEIYKITAQYVSDSNVYVPPHSTWWAVDLILVDRFWNEVDMWSQINFPWEISNITYHDITSEQKKNRAFLVDTMISFGFANLATEWWHFSYWDPIWAYFYWKTQSLYGKKEHI